MSRFNQTIKIGRRLIGINYPTYFIAEIGANFDQDLAKAKKLALAAKEAGADAVKIQSFLADKIVSSRGFSSMQLKGVHGSWDKPVAEKFKEAEFPRPWHKEFFDYCRQIGITPASAPYDFEVVDLLDELGVEFYKIGSGDITWLEMLQYIAKKGKPVFLATGDATLAEVDEAVATIERAGNKDLVLLQCITNYPSKIESANINVLKTYRTAFGVLTGYSDHSPGDVVALGAVALGGRAIEKHFTLDRNSVGIDHQHSMEPAEFAAMIKKIHDLEAALGSSRKEVVAEEAETVIVQRRSLYVAKPLAKGETITAEHIAVLRPALGIPPKFREIVAGHRVRRDLAAGEPLQWEDLS